jgi:VanZ family protein
MTTSRKILLGLIVLVCYLCLFPWQAKQGAAGPWFLWHWPQGRSGVADIFLNILLYVPIGICAPFAFQGRWRFLFAILLGSGLSFTVEYLQGWLPMRVSSAGDLASNSAGTLAGAGLAMWISHWGYHELPWLRGLRIRYPILVLLACFLAGQCFPFVPNYRLPHLRESLEALTDFSGDPFVALLNLTVYSAIGLLLRNVVTPEPAAWVRWLAPALFLALRPLFTSAPMGGLELSGAVAGVAVGTVAGRNWLRRVLFLLYPAVLMLDQLRPFTFLSDAQPFAWLPFLPLYSLPPMVVVRYLAEKLFLYGSGIVFLAQWPLTLPFATAMIVVMLGITEGLQVYLPGRTPESTDPLLALACWAMLAAGSGTATEHSSLDGTVEGSRR